MSDDVPVGVVGKITTGKEQGWFAKVEADPTGGYLIAVSPQSDFSVEGYDYWVDGSELPGFFEEAGWRVEWGTA